MNVTMRVLMLFILMAAGFICDRWQVIDRKGISGLNSYVLYFAQPCLIVASMQRPADPALLGQLGLIFVLGCVTMGVSGVIGLGLFVKEPAERRCVLANLCLASNCGFMGYPVITAALGDDALIYAVIFVAAFYLMCWTLGTFAFAGAKAISIKELVTNPTLIAVALGLLLFLTGWRLPGFLSGGLTMLGDTTTPVALFVIGSRLNGLKKEHLTDQSMFIVCGLRLIALPLLVYCLRWLGLPTMVVDVLFLATAMPCASLTAMQAELYHCDADLASRGVAFSTVLSLVTIPLMVLLIA